MTVTWNVSLGQILMILTLLGGFLQLNYKLNIIVFKTKLMWADYCKRYGLEEEANG